MNEARRGFGYKNPTEVQKHGRKLQGDGLSFPRLLVQLRPGEYMIGLFEYLLDERGGLNAVWIEDSRVHWNYMAEAFYKRKIPRWELRGFYAVSGQDFATHAGDIS